VPSAKPGKAYIKRLTARLLHFYGNNKVGSHAAGTARSNGVLLFAVKVYHLFGGNDRIIKTARTEKSDLLVGSEKALDRRVSGNTTVDNGKHHRDRRAVVAAERCSARTEPTVLNIKFKSVAHEVMLHTAVLLAHHVGVSLKQYGALMFASLCGGNAHENIVASVTQAIAAAVGGKLFYHPCNGFLVARSARYCGYLLKKLKHAARLKSFGNIFFHIHTRPSE